ncbi:glycerol-3-phosphate dehydrogenase, mitochondrial [Phascolarctos cinereus]|uniref:Glycerol-3-phosphate dehydrogenase n=1 Tax=Phascolarctos cinereus TaxID=38626 RepID=A0A6P5LPW7_PHACI|nr:glycerol-3-phosphate dehydrogenase, mitochondrial [Phascolarctos cinereus]XP_020860521.1 glycerol-3-phosphate dehydrogenase, mitochondrial [Phascolarctos cinereus]XP_020860522.1 glycerol-3-phosphate dehydrogenase, mitochondrial [Phascolarctos cinereus]XP_020860523.1 glycerol-3-phosphate dehydrogenase, mitochondrial [Phascolarctos cinereus]XP_020860524.1 glycerol-3-phosphate dehydrogenase, mitochondrial [Phascolarctos cinereus]XP_020860525.1 glycerol-3-phosphate dehydrogenase, mitochondrial 
MAFQQAIKGTALVGGGALATVLGLSQFAHYRRKKLQLASVEAADWFLEPQLRELPSREAQLTSLQSTTEFDILVIGGGATGAGCALDAVTRGLRTALVERDDFSSGTSSRSTKLIHGGVRYLQKAILNLDYEQYRMVKEALHERANLLEIAPHLSHALPIMLPIYKWWQLPYYWVGIKLYDLVAGAQCLKSSYVLSKSRALEHFPMLQKDKLVGAIVYYDGQHNDARMNLAIALTAARYGAATANYVEVRNLLKKKDPHTGKLRVSGAQCRDMLTGQEFEVRAKCVINATGPFTDTLRKMDNQTTTNICQPSAGVHIVMPGYYSPESMGLLDPATSDGRVIFFLPWQKMTIAGTTDSPTDITSHPIPSEEDINFILSEVRNYLSCDVEVRRGDVLAAWSGIRPLVTDPKSKDTQSISRNHVVDTSESGLITIAGGKWTTYRSMAEDTIDIAIKNHNFKAGPSRTSGLYLQGGKDWSPTLYIRLVQDYGLESEVAQHLASTYGDKAFEVAKIASVTGKRWPIVGVRLVSEFPYIEAEVKYGIKEYACTAVDMISRRTRLAFLNVQAAEEALPKIVELMGRELNWSEEKKKEELDCATRFLYYEMGYKSRSEQLTPCSEISLQPADIERYKKRFHMFDKEQKGFITIVDVQRVLESVNIQMNQNTLHEILNEVDLNKNGLVELDEFLQLMSAIQKGMVSGSRLAVLMKTAEESLGSRAPIPVDRSCGGL